jgi:hypothetical protein
MTPKRPPNKNTAAKRSYNKEYGAKTSAQRSQRNKARRAYEKANGPCDGDVNHKKPIAEGGTNAASNLECSSDTKNRGWRRGAGAKNYGKGRTADKK